MTSYYSVVQYVPNPMSGERVNVGVIAFDGHAVRTRFLRNWTRARRVRNPRRAGDSTGGGRPGCDGADIRRRSAHGHRVDPIVAGHRAQGLAGGRRLSVGDDK